jgi:hypothetical protein
MDPSNLEITKHNVNSVYINEGQKILKENDFFNGLNNIMSNNDFRLFYDKYFGDITDVNTVILYMKLYETIQKEYKTIYNVDIQKELLVYMMKELMSDNNTRKNILESFYNYSNNKNNNKNLLDIFEQYKSRYITLMESSSINL